MVNFFSFYYKHKDEKSKRKSTEANKEAKIMNEMENRSQNGYNYPVYV